MKTPAMTRLALAFGAATTVFAAQAQMKVGVITSATGPTAVVGIPAVSIDPGHDVVGKGKAWGDEQSADYRAHRYHQPSDEFNPSWDWSEGVQMGQLGYWLGWEAANAPVMPIWVEGDEFRAARDNSLSAAGK